MPSRPVHRATRAALLATALLASLGVQAAAAPSSAIGRESAPGASAADGARTPWWTGFHDPVLSTMLERLAQDRSLQPEVRRELETRTAGLYVQMRTVALRAQLLDEWLGVLGEQASTALAHGPTREAAAVSAELQQQALALEQRQRLLMSRVGAWKAVLARLQGQDLSLPDDLDRQLMAPSAPLFVPEGPTAELALRWASDETRGQLVRQEQTLKSADQVWQRQRALLQETQRRRAQNLASDADVVQAVQQLLASIDQLGDAAASLALVWIGVFAQAPIGVLEAQLGR